MESFRFLAVMLSWMVLGTVVACAGSVVLTQTHPAAPYVCRTGNITIRCQYDGLEGVLNVLWNVDNMTNLDLVTKTLPGHTALERTESHQDVVIASFAALRGTYDCAVVYSANITSSPNLSPGPIEDEGIALSALTLASRTATTLSVTWSAGYPKCFSFTVSHSTQDGSINVTQPAHSDISHTLTSLRPGTTYRIEVEAVRKGDRADGQRAKVIENFSTEEVADTSDVVPSGTIPPTTSTSALSPTLTAPSETAVVACQTTVTVLSVLLSLVFTLSLSICAVSAVAVAVMYKRLQRCRTELRGGEGESVKVGPEWEGPPTREEEEEGEKMQANPAYLPIEMSYKSQESKYINVPSCSD